MYAKNIDTSIAPASITKLMTALLLYENFPLNHEFITSYPSNYAYSGKVAYIPEGISLTTEELLELLLVYSANDAAFIVANSVFSNYEQFIDEMNNKSKELSMNSTNFVNPDGLDEVNHVTTANDLLKLSIYILENTKLLDITSKEDILLEVENNAQSILGYVVRWIDQGVGCSKVPDINDIGLMEDRATCRISSQILANWLKHEIISNEEVIEIMKKMAKKVDIQNELDNNYKKMSDTYETFAFKAACRLVLEGSDQPSGYTEPILHEMRLKEKNI